MTRSRRPAVLLALALIGVAISAYLAAFQVGLVRDPWDPIFHDGTRRVLTSTVSGMLPVPDAAIGAGAYAVDTLLGLMLLARPDDVTATGRAIAALLAVVAVGGASVALVLVVLQPLVARTFCSLCLASAAVSVALAVGAVAEARDRFGPANASRRHKEVHS
jgi:Vitamin K epoxide reductase family